MKKFLYITDQDEYTDHSFIGPLFKKYLKEYYDVDTVYFSEFKDETQFKDDRYVIPKSLQDDVIGELQRYGVDVSQYEYVAIRNTGEILKSILKARDVYNFKVIYRFSFPKRRAQMAFGQKTGFFNMLDNKIKTFSETNLINQCDLFMPASYQMHVDFFEDVDVKRYILPPAIDPELLHDNIQHEGEEKRFFFMGALDKIREFDTVLEAFSNVQGKFKLMMATEEEAYAKRVTCKIPIFKSW